MLMRILQAPILSDISNLVSLHGFFLVALNALLPFYPVARVDSGGDASTDRKGRLPAHVIHALIIVVALAVVLLFVPLYVRLLVRVRDGWRGARDMGPDKEVGNVGRGEEMGEAGLPSPEIDVLLIVILVAAVTLILIPLFLVPGPARKEQPGGQT